MTAGPVVVEGRVDAGTQAAAPRTCWRGRLGRRPVLVVLLVALGVRLLAAVATNRLGFQIPDEQQYIDLAGTVASGRPAEDWVPGYGQALYDSTFAFTGTLRALYEVTGPSRLVGQVLSAVAGALVAALTAHLLNRSVGHRAALAAGFTVALVPSQVLWSSVVLRESFVWLGAVLVAVAAATAARAERRKHLLACLAVATGGLVLIGFLRDQTMLVLTYALAASVWFYRPARDRWAQRAAAAALALLVPVTASIGLAGYDLVVQAVPNLAVARTNLSVGAESAITDPAPVSRSPAPGGSAGAPAAGEGTTGPGYLNRTPPGVVIEPQGAAGELSHLPAGVVAVTLRPLPWESGTSMSLAFARVENVVWLALYGLALLGLPAAWRLRPVMAFPALGALGILLSSALTQGNLGTAFRHRSQVLWALAALASLGVLVAASLLERRRGAAAIPGAARGTAVPKAGR